MIVVLFYSTNLLGKNSTEIDTSSANIFYGGADTCEVVEININDIKTVNGKLIELKYEKEINNKLKLIIQSDSIVTDSLQWELCKERSNSIILDKRNTKLRKQRNVCFCIAIVSTILAIIGLSK